MIISEQDYIDAGYDYGITNSDTVSDKHMDEVPKKTNGGEGMIKKVEITEAKGPEVVTWNKEFN